MEQKTSYSIPFAIPLIGLVLLLFGGLIYFMKNGSSTVSSTFSLSPTPEVSGMTTAEPDVTSWAPYGNTMYTFSIDVPADWNVQDYSKFYLTGGTVIAFSPDPLPCSTCSYFQDGFFSMHIYNEKTSPESYINFQQRIKSVGKAKEIVGVKLDGNTGVMYGNTVAVEYKGWVYEFVLDKDKGNAKITDSKIFERAVSSLKFTDLKFGQ